MLRKKSNKTGKEGKIIYALKYVGIAQLFAWLFDFCENVRLEKWINQGVAGNMFLFEEMVMIKFAIGILGALLAIISMVYYVVKIKALKTK
ncbi:MAG: hypothetical protein IPO92_00815 [Saprospiraceae bacterium]|nr:hypothetical protein [Saprospiraceae bacterium]